jgi:hypothetical protein
MATRFRTYELAEGVFGTYDSNTEPMPTEFLRGPFDVNMEEAELIQEGANIFIVDNQAVVIPEGEG